MNEMEQARRFFLHSPADIAQSYGHWAEKMQQDRGIDYGCVLDKHIIPLHPGDLMAVVARPGHGKSSWMAYMAKREALRIAREGREKECVVYVSWEQSIEEIEAFFQSGEGYTSSDLAWGRADLNQVRKGLVKRARLPIWFIGTSQRHSGIKKPKMYVDFVYEAIEALRYEQGLNPTLLCLDYLQIVPISKRLSSRTEEVYEATVQLKQLLMGLGVAGIAGVQASRNVDTYQHELPKMSDAQWSSGIEQTADKQISVWRPIKKYDDGEFIPVPGYGEIAVDESLLLVKLLKQRFEKGYGVWPIQFKPQTLQVFDYDRRSIDL